MGAKDGITLRRSYKVGALTTVTIADSSSNQPAKPMIFYVASLAIIAVNVTKCKYLSTNKNSLVFINTQRFEFVDRFRHLGSLIDVKDVALNEMQGRVSKT